MRSEISEISEMSEMSEISNKILEPCKENMRVQKGGCGGKVGLVAQRGYKKSVVEGR